MKAKVDVAIVGAGIIGMAAALGLAKAGRRVALIDMRPLPTMAPLESGIEGYDLRVSALTRRSQGLLERLGVWPHIEAARSCAYQHMDVWDDEGTGRIAFHAEDIAQQNIGHIVENKVVAAALAEVIKDSEVQVYAPVNVLDIDNHSEGVTVTLETGSIAADLLLGADGALSKVRESQGYFTREWDYNHTGIVATVRMQHPHQHTAWQNFLTTGPLALLPLAEPHMVSIVWSCESSKADQLLALDDADFAQQLTRASQGVLGKVEACSQRIGFPLRQRHAVDYVKGRVVLIGDAAHTIHPLAGQGMNLGLADVDVLLQELQRSVDRRLPMVHPQGLKRYQRRRKADNLAMMWTMEGFKRLFARRELALRWLRNEGMGRLDGVADIKNHIVRHALGA
jgi:2-octaprenylphenol hydroxylase